MSYKLTKLSSWTSGEHFCKLKFQSGTTLECNSCIMQNKLILILEYSYTEYTDAQRMKILLSRITSVFILPTILRKIFIVRKINIPNLYVVDRFKWPPLSLSLALSLVYRANIVRNFRSHETDPCIPIIHYHGHKNGGNKTRGRHCSSRHCTVYLCRKTSRLGSKIVSPTKSIQQCCQSQCEYSY